MRYRLGQIKAFLFNKAIQQRLDVLGMPHRKFNWRLLRWAFLPEQILTIELRPRVKLNLYDFIDLARFRTIFLEDRLFMPLRTSEPLIISVGSRNGYDIIKYDLDYPGGKLLVLEPSAANRSVIRDNFQINRVDALILPYALTANQGKAILYKQVSSVGDRYLLDAIQAQSFSRVETRDIYWLLNHVLEPVDLLILNIPGYEEEVMLSLGDDMNFTIRRIILKENALLVNSRKIVKHMQSLGYFHHKKGRYHFFTYAAL